MSLRIRNCFFTIIGLALVALVITDTGAKTLQDARSTPVPGAHGSVVHGVNFQIKTFVDEAFCLETDVATSTTPRVFVARCTGRPNQRWTFTDGVDGSSVVVGDLGECLMVEQGPEPEVLAIAICDYHTDQRFTVSPSGLIMEKHSDKCLTINSPIVSGEGAFVEDCSAQLVREQTWRIAF